MARAPKAPTAASLKRVTPENLARLGPDRLAEILADVASSRPELKRRLRMELAAEQGADHLLVEIDRRLASLETSRSRVSWRKRASFVTDLDVLRGLIAERLAGLDPAAALERLWAFMDLARRLGMRVRDRDGRLGDTFLRAASDIGALVGRAEEAAAAGALADAVARSPVSWTDWLPLVLERAPPSLAGATLVRLRSRADLSASAVGVLRRLADAAGDIEAFQASFTPQALKTPQIAAEVARRLLQAGQVEAAGELLRASAPALPKARGLLGKPKPPEPDFDWESAWIDYLERSGRGEEAQAVRWASFERTLSAERARGFTSRLADFDDVEAEGRAFAYASGHADLDRALGFLIDWPALAEAARLIQARADELQPPPDKAEAWAARLRPRQPAAAALLLRKSAAAAFRRRDFSTCDRLTKEADLIEA
jgi:hypothetical protein